MAYDAARIRPSSRLANVRYEIRGSLARRAEELEKNGYDIVKLNIGNPGAFGFRAPETLRLAMIENMRHADAYCHQKGIFPAREAVVMQQQSRGVMDVAVDDVFIGNGVSELIMMALGALVDSGDEVLVPSPDYPLWTAATHLNGATPIHYPCLGQGRWFPDVDAMRRLITPRTRALVIISPNNPTGAVYPRALVADMVELAERHRLVIFSDEIYDQMTYEDASYTPVGTLCKRTLCGTFSGMSKIYRACGFRVGWLSFNGEKESARDYLSALETLASLRLCSNVVGQWAVQTALGGHQSIQNLVRPGGRLYETRAAVIQAIAESRYLSLVAPQGGMYAFPSVDVEKIPNFDDQEFALDLLERQHVLIAPGTSFNMTQRNCFRITLLPEPNAIRDVLARIEAVLDEAAMRAAAAPARDGAARGA